MPHVPVDIVGKRFGRLVVQEYAGRSFWHCLCDCGKRHVAKTNRLNKGYTRSCGCLAPDAVRERSWRHGHAPRGNRSAAYSRWSGMMSRCTNPDVKDYPRYGGRGIRVCERWHDFSAFLADMGEPLPGMTLDRIDTNGHYEPGNCRWINHGGQANNRRSNRPLTLGGETYGITEWARRTGIDRSTIAARLRRGWSVERGLGPQHLSSPDCWCGPEEVHPGVWVHHPEGCWEALNAILKDWDA
jgi:hypothetical protein